MKLLITSFLFFFTFALHAQKSEVNISPKNLNSWCSISVKSEFTGKHKLIISNEDGKKVIEKKLILEKNIYTSFKYNFKLLPIGIYEIQLIRNKNSLITKELIKKDDK